MQKKLQPSEQPSDDIVDYSSYDLPIKPARRTLRQTAVILNISAKTVRNYLDSGLLKWSGNQVSIPSILALLNSDKYAEESAEEIERKIRIVTSAKKAQRRILGPGIE